MDNSKLYKLDEVANILKITRRTLYDYIKEGKIKAVKMGKCWRVTHEDLQKCISTGFSVLDGNRREENSAPTVNQWISVEDHLPNCNGEDDIEVLVYIKGALTATTLYFEASSGEFFDEKNTYNVTHWQPLPEPPEVMVNE